MVHHVFVATVGQKHDKYSWDYINDHLYLPLFIYTHALSLAGLGVHVSSLSVSMNATILAQVNLNQNSIHCCFLSWSW